jgi:hypothetical protein
MSEEKHIEDKIDEALAETFPASDPPYFVASPPKAEPAAKKPSEKPAEKPSGRPAAGKSSAGD